MYSSAKRKVDRKVETCVLCGVQQPAGDYVVKVCQGHKDVYGCGVTSMLFLMGQLCRHVGQLAEQVGWSGWGCGVCTGADGTGGLEWLGLWCVHWSDWDCDMHTGADGAGGLE